MERAKKILIVDDDKNLAFVLELRLKKEGYEVSVALNGEEGLESIKTFHPDLVLMDLGMPGLAGDVAGWRIRTECKNVPMIALTGYGDAVTCATVRSMGFADHVMKPYEPEDLLARIAKAIAGSRDS